MLDIVKPHLQNEKSNVIVDCDIDVYGIWFKDDNDVLLCMKMYDLLIPTYSNIVDMNSNITNRLSVSNDVNCKLCLSDLKNDKCQFVAFKKPIMASGAFSIAEIQEIENKKYTQLFFLLGASDGHLFDTFVSHIRESVSVGYQKNIVNPLEDLKLLVKFDPDLVSYIYPYLDVLDTFYSCDINISVFFMVLKLIFVWICMT